MNAKEMFEQLGYEFKKEYTRDGVNDTYRYNKCSRPNDSVIFYLDGKQIIIYQTFNTIHVNELQAIIQQCKELGWLDEEQREETNLDHYKDEILEDYAQNLAVVKGRVALCYKTNCNACDFKINQIGCHEKVKDWLNKPYEKPKYKLTYFEHDLLSVHKDYKTYNNIANQIHLFKMHEKGYFKDIDIKIPICEILDNCEVTE